MGSPVGILYVSGPGDQSSIESSLQRLKMLLNTTLLNTQHYKVRIKGIVEQSRERSIALPLHICVVAFEKFRVAHDYGRQLLYKLCKISHFGN